MRRSRPDRPGITRRPRGRGFDYLDSDGTRITDEFVLDRIEALAVPPAWDDVWICRDRDGHLQAVGTDGAGRRQYLYHAKWRESRDAAKHERVLRFATALPEARARVASHLRTPFLSRDRALAACFRILDQASIRVGSEQYAVRNASHGLATLLRSHVHVRSGRVVHLGFPGKGGKELDIQVEDAALARAVTQLLRRRDGSRKLLAWRPAPKGPWRGLSSADINAYLRDVTGGPYTAKDFRTWNATILMAVRLAHLAQDGPKDPRRALALAARGVAEYLGNTPAVARASYIDGRVGELYTDGVVLPLDLATLPPPAGHLVAGETEAAVLEMLTNPRRAARTFARIELADDSPAAAKELLATPR